ncbi:aminoacyl-tRNA hydrolase [Macrococcus hajekii]|uniref:Peptidyl-tRNA hydrolase n=1 Tax=Macrococcus hajekii TaxID=198482 RepID=A0A4R6BHJ0_9STAP|nr:aminoacyl-tRNA hydrolase [Macrococcus hajekii]TDM01038.1 aminoacyl-tRNA hydrolase [Macrococcus hajekii]GGB12886.1 peptidyl-tRNA hydrolase [Macrococcus hajekii]
MKCIIGLGNIGRKYNNTRHNIGFMVIDAFCEKHGLELDKQKFNGLYTIATINGEKVLLIEPMTYMNASGEAVRPLLDYYQVPTEDILVLYDDLDMPPGRLRLRPKGSAGGHNGIRSLIHHLGSDVFKRIRIGIGRPPGRMKVPDFVLQKFSAEEMITMDLVIDRTIEACETFLSGERFENVMNQYNGDVN